MFQELAPLLEQNSFTLTLSRSDNGQITVGVLPILTDKKADSRLGLKAFSITGTPEELDQNLSQLLTTYQSEASNTQQAISSALAELKETEAKLQEEIKQKKKKLKKPEGNPEPTPAPITEAAVNAEPLPEVQEGLGK